MDHLNITAIVPVFNRATTVLPTLESIAGQSVLPRRLIVVDDGSSDGSAESIEAWIAARKPACATLVIRQRNGGVSSARNRAIAAAADCDWFAFLDSDDVWPPDFIARATKALTHEPSAVAATADRLYVEVLTGAQRRFDLEPMAHNPPLWMLRLGAAVCSCSVVRADLVLQLGGFPEHLSTGEDAALFLPLSQHGRWLHLPGEPVQFCRRAAQAGSEEASLSRKFCDNQRRWARVYDAFFSRLSDDQRRQIGHRQQVRQQMSERWRRAGLELERHGQMLGAAACYARSIRWRPTKWERWQPLVRMPWRVLAGASQRAA
jgi:glycosyltransferase involved in cell wall biosynthesis